MFKKIIIFATCFLIALGLTFWWSVAPAAAVLVANTKSNAKAIDSYVAHYLQAKEPILLEIDNQGGVKKFSSTDLSSGKKLFEQHCLNCHVGGATLPDPTISLSLKALQGALPPRDNIGSIVAFLREPMTYDGTDFTYWCRQVPETWISQTEIENLAAFVLRAAQKAPGWGTTQFDL